MTKEIKKEKIEITLEIFNNIKAMIKSSNEEDFFIGIKMWFAMDPPDMLTAMLRKHAWKGRGHDFDEFQKSEKKWSLAFQYHRLSWPAILARIMHLSDPTVVGPDYKQWEDIINQEANAYINQKLYNEGIGEHIEPIKFKLKWHI